MSNFRDLQLQLNFDTGIQGSNVTRNFYIPVLERSVKYDRVAGYFSSASLGSAARGVAGLVRNGGRMRLITSHALQRYDVNALTDLFNSEALASQLIAEFENSYKNLGSLGDAIIKNHVGAMCWMLKNGYLEIRVVVPTIKEFSDLTAEELEKFHPKFGIFEDADCNQIAFVGSINETSSAWRRNIESFEVFQDWQPGSDKERIRSRKNRFSDYWNNNIGNGWQTIDLPEAVRIRLIEQFAPEDFPEDLDYVEEKEDYDGLRYYQRDALESWIKAGRKGLFEMATGTGKTRTARACIESSMLEGSLITLVVAPYSHIANQWKSELAAHDPYLVSSSWKRELPEMLLEARRGWRSNLTLISVQNTAASHEFTQLLEESKSHFANFLMVGDEVHWLGAKSFQGAMMKSANFRLGLSATPKRYFDEEGSTEIQQYFGETVYEFPLREALKVRDENGKRILCDYEYHPRFVELSETELNEYRELTRKIYALENSKDKHEFLQRIRDLRIERARIIKSAESKIPELRKLLNELPKPIKHTLVYCADEAQLNEALVVLNEFGIAVQKITGEEGSNPSAQFNNLSERQHIIENFAQGKLDVLLAIRCLDEGVDIPAAKTSIILASSGNEKEFIQRRGRVMRTYPGKTIANIYDLCVLPEDPENRVGGIWEREKTRILEYAEDALNFDEVKKLVERL